MSIFSADFKTSPYWWDITPRPSLKSKTIDRRLDVAIIGSGYTGLCAALTLSRAGRSVTVFDAEDAGWGCSSRNGGQVSTSIKPQYNTLVAKYGQDIAASIIKEGYNSLSWIKNFVSKEKIDCSFAVPGRFYAAHSGKQFDILVNQIENQPAELAVEAEVVPKDEQKNELGSDVYHGGIVFRSHASLDPARYHQGILTLAIEADVSIISNSRVVDLKRSAGKFELTTTEGGFVAQEVIIATNGYTGKLTPWLRRRVIPIGSYMIATEPINPDLMNELMPKKRVVSDTRKVVYYYRPSPDGTRIIFGGRVTSGDSNLHKSGSLLRKELIRIFPQLSNIKISHSWMGFVAYTFDELPHIGNNDGLHYAMGCCGSGVGMASYLGTRLGKSLLTSNADIMGLERIGFKTRPFYNGNPWFLPASVAYYRWLDNIR